MFFAAFFFPSKFLKKKLIKIFFFFFSSPIVVHCSAGVGRTGTFCVVHYLLAKVRLANPSTISMMDTLLYFRKYRPHMVQSVDQYLFCHRAITEHFNPPPEEEVKKTAHYQKFEEVRKVRGFSTINFVFYFTFFFTFFRNYFAMGSF